MLAYGNFSKVNEKKNHLSVSHIYKSFVSNSSMKSSKTSPFEYSNSDKFHIKVFRWSRFEKLEIFNWIFHKLNKISSSTHRVLKSIKNTTLLCVCFIPIFKLKRNEVGKWWTVNIWFSDFPSFTEIAWLEVLWYQFFFRKHLGVYSLQDVPKLWHE